MIESLASQYANDWGFFVPYLIGSISLIVLAIGSISPGYDIKLNDAILAEEKHLPMYDELVKKYKVEYIAGVDTSNSWCYKLYGIGKDKFGEEMKKNSTAAGVNLKE
ncbi:hypothetical protein Cni_G16235 [Canna indica]|uniref:Adenosine kinase n=1 Tax=Canna indica TaxID=4628 RepID=A0AAQ3KIB6_9LILI|nr:hypothetical protein Cni_G16235 [Canna indica]